MAIFPKLNKNLKTGAVRTQFSRSSGHPFACLNGYMPFSRHEMQLYQALREAVPVIDAAVCKIVRLTGGFDLECADRTLQEKLADFCRTVRCGPSSQGMDAFVSAYLEGLLTYGSAVAEIVLAPWAPEIYALCNAPLSAVEVRADSGGTGVSFALNDHGESVPVRYPQLILFSALNPPPGEARGVSLLRGLPYVSNILLKIFNTIGTNWERVGNVRYAVTYKPGGDLVDRAYARERAMNIAEQWRQTISSTGSEIKDFVAIGDVSVRVIGADNQVLDSQVPVRQLMEQIVAKTGLPPFLLGLSWSTSERMSRQQADILTSELEYYRGVLTPVILKVCRLFSSLSGYSGEDIRIKWRPINLQDAVDEAKAALYTAQAAALAGKSGEES